MNSPSRCGRSEPSAASSSRRSAVTTRRGVELNAASSQRALPAVLVRQQLANPSDHGPVRAGHDDAGIAIIVPNQLTAASARRHHTDGLIRFGLTWMGYAPA